MQTMTPPFTRALYDRLPEGFPAQLIDGQLLHDPSPTHGHQALVGALFMPLASLVGLQRAFMSPIDVYLDELNVVQPDVAVYEKPPPLHERHGEIPSVVFEVLSPSNRRLDRVVKAAKYLAAGVREVWLVDPDPGTIKICTPGDRHVHSGASTARSAVIEGYAVVPAELFAVTR